MTSDMGGLYKIAEALRSNPEQLERDDKQLELTAQRLELDRRALAIQYAKDTVSLDFRTDKDPNPPPEYQRVLETARAYYAFLIDGPSTDREQDR